MSGVSGVSIESAVNYMYEKVAEDATNDLRGMVGKVDDNMKMKEQIRGAQRKLEAYKEAVRNGNDAQANALRQEIYYMLADSNGVGLNYWNSDIGPAVWNLPGSGLSAMNAEQRDKIINDQVKGVERMLDTYAQNYSDIGQKLQFQLNEANNIYTRAIKAQSDTSSKYHQTLQGIAQNIKG